MKPSPHHGNNLLRAGIDAIKIGVEDIKRQDRARKIAAIRNFYAGVLLLCKHRLVQHSPEDNPYLLIAAKTKFIKNETGKIVQVPVGNKTIGATELIERLQEFEKGLDARRLKDLQKHRNDIEHYFTEATNEKLQEVFADVQLLVNDLLVRSSLVNELGPGWAKMVEESNAFISRREKCRQDLLQISWRSTAVRKAISGFRFFEPCECESNHILRMDQSNNIQNEIALMCLSCNASISTASFIEALLECTYAGDDWEAAMAGDPYYAIYECAECERNTYVTEENECAVCGYSVDEVCDFCGESLGIVHVSRGDSYHDECAHRVHQMEKD